MRRFMTVGAVTLAVTLGVMSAAAPSAIAADEPKAVTICEKSGGLFVEVSPTVYACVFPSSSEPQNRKQAQKACNKDGGLYVDVSPLVYACVLPGGTLPLP